MADPHDHSPKPTRAAPPPFVGPSPGGGFTPKTRVDRPTLPPFSPPFVKRPSPVVRPPQEHAAATGVAVPATPVDPTAPASLEAAAPNEPAEAAPGGEVGIAWVNPDEPTVAPPPQAATGIEWLDSPDPDAARSSSRASEEDADPFGWDPAEERAGALDTAPTSGSLEALKELEPWALPGMEPSASSSEEVAVAIERIAARIRSGDLFVPGALAAASEEAVLAAVLAALLQRTRG